MSTPIKNRLLVRSLADIEDFEQTPLGQRLPALNTYELIRGAATRYPDRIALRFFTDPERYTQDVSVTYGQFLARLHQTANLLTDLGIQANDVVSLLLPNLLQTQYLLWGGEAAGIVNPINSFLEPAHIAAIMRKASTKVLAVLGPLPGTEVWSKVRYLREQVPSLQTILQIGGAPIREEGCIHYDRW